MKRRYGGKGDVDRRESLSREYDPPRVRGVAIEINHQLAARLEERFPRWLVYRDDFLIADRSNIGLFDRILMNPPFDHGVDIKHIATAGLGTT